jgi:hypothetical protein
MINHNRIAVVLPAYNAERIVSERLQVQALRNSERLIGAVDQDGDIHQVRQFADGLFRSPFPYVRVMDDDRPVNEYYYLRHSPVLFGRVLSTVSR